MNDFDKFLVVENLQAGCNSPVRMYEFDDLVCAEHAAFESSKFCSRVYGVYTLNSGDLSAHHLLRVYANFQLTFSEVGNE